MKILKLFKRGKSNFGLRAVTWLLLKSYGTPNHCVWENMLQINAPNTPECKTQKSVLSPTYNFKLGYFTFIELNPNSRALPY